MSERSGVRRPRVVHVWERMEVTLYAERAYANPYTDVDFWVDLAGPGGQRRVYGFWDGGNAFRVRLVAPEPGAWTWTSGASTGDPGLSGHSGSFRATEWSEEERRENPCRRGMPRPSASGHALDWADGTPCFLVGDTWWSAPTFRYPWYDDDVERPIGPGTGFKDMVRFRKAQGYNCIAIIAALPNWANDGHPPRIVMDDPEATAIRAAWQQAGTESAKDMHNPGGRPFLFPGRVPGYEDVFPDVDRINPAYFQHMDLKIDYLNAQGFVPFIEVARRDVSQAWKRFYDWPDSYGRYVRYVWARYQANICILSPIHFDSPGLSIPSRDYNEPANRAVMAGVPAFGNPISCNAAGSSLLNFGPRDEARWLSLHQIGNKRDHNSHWLLTHIYREADPPAPALNGEPYYAGWPPDTDLPADSEEADAGCRSGMYGSFLSGGLAGHIYGAAGLWGGDIEPGARYTMWDALRFRSGAQMLHLRQFALSEGARYQELVPDADLVHPNRTPDVHGNRGWAYCAATPEKDLYMIYFEGGCAPATVRCLRYGTTYRARWFDPRTGEWREAPALRADAFCEARLPPLPTEEDWALVLTLIE